MKKLILLLCLLGLISTVKAQIIENWQQVNSPTNKHLWSVHFVDDNRGWISGDSGLVIHTEDGGETWQQQFTGSELRLQSIHFVDEYNGWTVGKDGNLFYTNDGGNNWNFVEGVADTHLTHVFFINKNVGWITGAGGLIMKSEDGGKSWSKKESGTSEYMTAIEFIDENTGYATAPLIILKSEDGGESWTQAYKSGSEEYKDLALTSVNSVWVAGRNWGSGSEARIIATTDGGENWQPQETGITGSSIISVSFRNEMNGLGVGNKGKIIVTRDGGNSWDIQPADSNDFYLDAQLLPSGAGYICGMNGMIKKKIVRKSLKITAPEKDIQKLFYPGDNLEISWTSEGIEDMKLEYSINFGKNWQTIDENIPAVNNIDGSGTSHGSYTWQVPYKPTSFLKLRISSGDLEEVIPADEKFPNIAYVIASQNTKWEKTKLPTDAALNSVFFIDEQNGWICGSEGTILNTTDAGNNWTEQATPVNEDLNEIIFEDELNGVCFGTETILVTDDGGANWHLIRDLIDDDVVMIDFVDKDNGWMVKPFNNNLILYKTENGGQNWNNIFSFNMEQLNSGDINFVNAQFGWSWWFEGLDTIYLNRTSDAGFMWNSVELPGFNKYLEINMYSEDFGVVLGREEETGPKTLYVTENKGVNWERVVSDIMPKYVFEDSLLFSTQLMRLSREVNGVSEQNNYRLIQISDNACMDWSLNYFAPADSSNKINNFFTYDGNILWAAADNGFLYKAGEIVTKIENETHLVEDYRLYQNYPNPFNPATTIKFNLPEKENVMLEVYNLLGERLSVLINEEFNAGEHSVKFDGSNLSSGIYLYRITTEKFEETKKFVLMK